MSSNKMVHPILGIGFVIIITMSIAGYYLYTNGYFTNPGSSNYGSAMSGCFLDPNGKPFGCTNALKLTIGQDVQSGNGQPISGYQLSSATGSFNYSGNLISFTYAATLTANLAKGVSYSYPVTASGGQGSSTTNFPLSLPKSTWTASELSTAWGSNYGNQKPNFTLSNISVCGTFQNGQTLCKPSSTQYVVSTTFIYTAPTTNSIGTPGANIGGGTSSGGTTDTWGIAANAATGGMSGNQASNGMACTLAADITGLPQSLVWCWFPSSMLICPGTGSCSIFITLITRSQSISATIQGGTGYNGFWANALFSARVSPGDIDIVQVFFGGQRIFNQVVPVSVNTPGGNGGPAIGVNPPTNYYAQWQVWQAASVSSTTNTTGGIYTSTTVTYTQSGGPGGSNFQTSTVTTSGNIVCWIGPGGGVIWSNPLGYGYPPGTNTPLGWPNSPGWVPYFNGGPCRLMSLSVIRF